IADVRDLAALRAGIDSGTAVFGEIDIVVANAGVVGTGLADPDDEQIYLDIVGTNLFGVWHTIVATAPSMIRRGGGSMVLISSMQGLVGRGGDGAASTFAYAASKHGVVGLMRSASYAYAQHGIRVNSVHPTGVATPMILNEHMARVFAANPDPSAMSGNLMPVPYVEPMDVTSAVVWLTGDGARYITGVALPVDAGFAVM
ncbi:MAG: SDR family oxidoreductase, partial [Actinomycetota bacterium]|nr:SDR family oxidoreductase [Actinomycetota bacterium]